MSIRSTAKAIVLHDNHILVNQCVNNAGNVYYDLPGGGQNQFETIENALIREVLEETGYVVKTERFLALAEEICDDEQLRKNYFHYTHRIFYLFLAHLVNEEKCAIKEMDWQQQRSLWVPLEEINRLNFRPYGLTGKISELLEANGAQYLGCSRYP